MKINKYGNVFIAPSLIISIVLFLLNSKLSIFFGTIFLLITGFIISFFRDPERVMPNLKKNDVLSPADGIVTSIQKILHEDQNYWKISIFLSIFDVHINRIPISGKIIKKTHKLGRFLDARTIESSDLNESLTIVIKTENNHKIFVKQIAGLLARRIICEVNENDTVEIGNRYGIIKFSSRVDLLLPANFDLLVKLGQTVIGSETIIAELKETQGNDNIK